MRISILKRIMWLFLIVTACSTSDRHSDNTPIPTQQPSPTELNIEERLQIEDQYEQLRQAHIQMQAIWEGLMQGKTAQCGEGYTILAPDQIPESTSLQVQLRAAARELSDALSLWLAECENPRQTIPQDVIERGVLMVRSAGDSLSLVEKSLAEDN